MPLLYFLLICWAMFAPYFMLAYGFKNRDFVKNFQGWLLGMWTTFLLVTFFAIVQAPIMIGLISVIGYPLNCKIWLIEKKRSAENGEAIRLRYWHYILGVVLCCLSMVMMLLMNHT